MEHLGVLVLGAGFVGRRLKHCYPSVCLTSRSPGRADIIFDLYDQRTWANLPKEVNNVVWTFPAASSEGPQASARHCLAEEFFDTYCVSKNVVVYGSTSCYLTEPSRQWQEVTEESSLNLEDRRVITEEALRKKGAMLLVLAGIFGLERDPIRWLSAGRVLNGESLVNLIHISDIVELTLAAFEHFSPGERINLSCGHPLKWNDVADEAFRRGLLADSISLDKSIEHARLRVISNEKCRRYFNKSEFQGLWGRLTF
jgi:nucleoside-diphosphate-sugar epimerase